MLLCRSDFFSHSGISPPPRDLACGISFPWKLPTSPITLQPAGVRTAHVRCLPMDANGCCSPEEEAARVQLRPRAAMRSLNGQARNWSGVVWTGRVWSTSSALQTLTSCSKSPLNTHFFSLSEYIVHWRVLWVMLVHFTLHLQLRLSARCLRNLCLCN